MLNKFFRPLLLDFSKCLMIVDPSLYQLGESSISLNLFKPQMNLLPDIRGVGDIILCRKLMVGICNIDQSVANTQTLENSSMDLYQR